MTFCEVAAVVRSNPKWTTVLIKTLTELHEQGYSATAKQRKINELFGTKFTRNSIIGATHRANLPKRASTRLTGTHAVHRLPKQPRPPRIRTERKSPPPYVPVPSIVDLDIPQQQRRTLLELTAHTCRWPVGEVGAADFFFCGAEPMADRPYCAAHNHRASYVRVR